MLDNSLCKLFPVSEHIWVNNTFDFLIQCYGTHLATIVFEALYNIVATKHRWLIFNHGGLDTHLSTVKWIDSNDDGDTYCVIK